MPGLVELIRAVEAEGHDFLPWADWFPGGRPDRAWSSLRRQSFPAARHWVHHSVTSASDPPEIAARKINSIGISRFGIMSYPFLVHRTGSIIQGCYPYIGAHTRGFNSTTLAACNVGNYEETTPTDAQIEANAALVRALASTGHYPSPRVPIDGHRDAPSAATSCPGARLYARLGDIRTLAYTAPPAPDPPTTPEDDMPFLAKNQTNPTGTLLFEEGRMTVIDSDDIDVFTARFGKVVLVSDDAGWKRLIKDRTLYR